MSLYERFNDLRAKLIRELNKYSSDDVVMNNIKNLMDQIDECWEEMENKRHKKKP
jgi:flagellin-specific chaperone FliS